MAWNKHKSLKQGLNGIRLFVRGNEWYAEFVGPHADRVRHAFGGTAVLPTPYRSNAPASLVIDSVRRKNPDCFVELQ